MASLFFAQPGMSLKADRFDADSRYLNLRNGVYDLHEGRLHPHHPSFLVTQQVNASYDPDAKALRWEQFLAEALPDEGLRKYVQRCLGYTLLGNPSERAMFVVYGPSGTGKSTFLETINAVLGSYGETAPAGTFRTSRNTDDTAPTPALHQLRGKRFVTTSETSEGVQWNEELVKRYTGRDLMRSRGLYESYQTWRNEASIWLATNHAPRFTSDDLAIWKRVKLIPFETVFLGEDQILAMDEILIQEADGILNWLLEGLAAYNDLGLDEPAMVTESVQRLREQSDSVVRFLNDRIDEGMLEASPGTSTSMVVLLGLYTQWCRDAGERPVGGRRFRTRLETTGRDISVTPDGRIVLGVRRPLGGWLAQT
jgi:putative DNA primase/helicase